MPQSSTARFAKAALPATVTILTTDSAGHTISLGSRFIIRIDGVVITHWHVMQGASRALVIPASGDSVDQVAASGGGSAADKHDVLERWNLVESPEGASLVRRNRQALAAVVRSDSGGFASGGAPEIAAN